MKSTTNTSTNKNIDTSVNDNTTNPNATLTSSSTNNPTDIKEVKEKLTKLDELLKREMNKNWILEKDLKELNEYKLPQLNKAIALQESISDHLLISNIVKDQTALLTPSISRTYFRNEIQQNSQISFLQNKNELLRKEIDDIKKNFLVEIDVLANKYKIEIEKNNTLNVLLGDKDKEINKLKADIEKLLKSNSILSSEGFCYLKEIQQMKEDKQWVLYEIEYLRDEVILLRKDNDRLKKQYEISDKNFRESDLLLKEYQKSIINMEVSNVSFPVVKIGNFIETNAEVNFFY